MSGYEPITELPRAGRRTALTALVAVFPGVALLLSSALLLPSLDAGVGGLERPRMFQRAICIASGLAAIALIALWLRQHAVGAAALGLGRAGLKETLRAVALPTAGAVALLLALALARPDGPRGIDPLGMRWVRAILTYAGWAVVQQVLILGYVFTRLRHEGLGERGAILATTVVFAAFHLPNPALVALTFASGLVWVPAYARHRNLLGVAASHALIGLVAQEVVGMDTLTGLHYLERIALG